ncbi:MAG TPA: galactonate dehydratase [Chloroflexota bacterium]|nr:galactonate dehydratase [Chloroflexota bacterium]
MKIRAISTHFVYNGPHRNWTLVKIDTDEGIHGWGEATVEGKEKTVAEAIRELERQLIGRDPFEIERLWQQMYRDAFWVGGPILNSAISGIELALWDIKGKALGVPVWQLLGGKIRNRIRAYANGWFRGAKTPRQFAEAAVRTVEQGFTALKWDPFGGAGLFIEREQEEIAVAIVREVRNAVGPAIDLLIEVHGRFSPANAIRIARRLEEFAPFWYEEPVPPENVDSTALVARSIAIPVATGERLFTKWGFKDILEKQAAAIIQPDICHDGGILETRKIAAMAEVYYVGVAPHNPNGPLSTAACLQVDACTPNFLIQEFVVSDSEIREAIQKEPLPVVDGHFLIPERPGLGVDLDEAALARFPYQPTTMTGMMTPASNFQRDS